MLTNTRRAILRKLHMGVCMKFYVFPFEGNDWSEIWWRSQEVSHTHSPRRKEEGKWTVLISNEWLELLNQWRHQPAEWQIKPLSHRYHRLKANATIFAVTRLHLSISELRWCFGDFFFCAFVCFVLSKRPFGWAICRSLSLSSRPAELLFNSVKMSPSSRQL